MIPSDSDLVAFPDPNEIEPHAVAFTGMMFAHAAFEREISVLLDAITESGFGEQHRNRWTTRERPRRIVKLIETHRGNDFPQTKQIETLLNAAIIPCEQRNHLTHATWWGFNRRTSALVVRGATRREHPEIPPESHEYTADDIYELLEKFKVIEAELYKLRRSIEQPNLNREETFAEIETELNKLLRRSIERPANPDEIKEEPDKTVEQPKNSPPNRDEPKPS